MNTIELERSGYAVAQEALPKDEIVLIRRELTRLAPSEDRRGGVRSLGLKSDAIRALAVDGPPAALARKVLGSEARPVKITGFDKSSQANWVVPLAPGPHHRRTREAGGRGVRPVDPQGRHSPRPASGGDPVAHARRACAPRRHSCRSWSAAGGPREPSSGPDRPAGDPRMEGPVGRSRLSGCGGRDDADAPSPAARVFKVPYRHAPAGAPHRVCWMRSAFRAPVGLR